MFARLTAHLFWVMYQKSSRIQSLINKDYGLLCVAHKVFVAQTI